MPILGPTTTERDEISDPSEESAMLEAARRLRIVTRIWHRSMKPAADAVGELLVDAFHLLALFAIGATTVWSAVAAFIAMVVQGHATLSDILLLFIYL